MSATIDCWRVLAAKVCAIRDSSGDIVLRLTTDQGEHNFLFAFEDFGLFADSVNNDARLIATERSRVN